MKRSLCDLAPVFSEDLVGKNVNFTCMNRKGKIKAFYTGRVYLVKGTFLVMRAEGHMFDVHVEAKRVYYGTDTLEVIE